MQQQKRIIIGCDPAAYDLKCSILDIMCRNNYHIDDAGCPSAQEGLYSVVAKKVAHAVANNDYDCGILLCGTGQGMAMAANKVRNVRAALCHDVFPAIMSKRDNNANVLCMGAWLVNTEKAIDIIEAWLFSDYAGNHDEGLALLED